ncbi:MAG: sugar transferase [Algoriphagus sp.]|nr:sugar transferase [Algoriphagus sp.]
MIDFVLSSLMFLILSPIFIFLLVSLSIHHGGTPFFLQRRPGLNTKPFYILKFKTMKDLKDSEGNQLSDEFRITGFGKWVRKYSLDEIPQLINVIKGDMSLVGPRPLLEEYLPLYSEFQNRRHEVRPGVSGWAQVNGRNAISWEKKFELDVWYVDQIGFMLDLKILFMTLFNVLLGKGVTQKGHVSSGKFLGKSVPV